uniref:GAG-pre-integrase domain-containing protein n=1 Tax=Nelumbo nucifera TaxID=4432 RepID=A0A822ZNZ1_NELNU|nr:TPA_asm: hypothetical protein HUJ06_001738 [Nelumbo nucifera]
MTLDFSNLQASQEYTGSEKVQVGNGSGLAINHVGRSTLTFDNQSFLFTNILHVPSISKNLVSVSQFTRDNNLIVEFHSSHFVVKDPITGKEAIRGPNVNGLYQFPSSSNGTPCCSSQVLTACASTSQWHARLGHPSLEIVRRVLSSFSYRPIPSANSRVQTQDPCFSRQRSQAHYLSRFLIQAPCSSRRWTQAHYRSTNLLQTFCL